MRILIFTLGISSAFLFGAKNGRENFVDIKEFDKSIMVDARYFTQYNFIGTRIAGYKAGKCLLTLQAATALKKVQDSLRPYDLSLKVYDCYRPQKAVNHFVRWAKDLKDKKMKADFYPHIRKNKLFKLGYIAEKSGHSRGSTIDLTLVATPIGKRATLPKPTELKACFLPLGKRFDDLSLDMGTAYDCFDKRSHTKNPNISREGRSNRALLRAYMEKGGFENYEGEWWHYTLAKEPFPDTHFNFDVE